VTIDVANPVHEVRLDVTAVKADAPVAVLPSWLGRRPPVDGKWVMALDDEFSGPKLDTGTWDVTGPNYYDSQTHWSKDDVVQGNGNAALVYEKKQGYQNDDPTGKQTAYAAGFLQTYGKWTQRYGYFEARMKLPTAPGLWPAFWMMPDRGASAGEQWQRQDTGNGGMEFDVMEHLTRWGPHRYNIAIHYDGYGKDHKAVGSDKIYVQADRDGFITCGLLWTPGLAVFYCNGKEVLRWENPRISKVPEDLMFTMPQGGWDNNAVDDAKLPDRFVIDYVRVWQRK
jgi:beta-glucanase (GH16 family)